MKFRLCFNEIEVGHMWSPVKRFHERYINLHVVTIIMIRCSNHEYTAILSSKLTLNNYIMTLIGNGALKLYSKRRILICRLENKKIQNLFVSAMVATETPGL